MIGGQLRDFSRDGDYRLQPASKMEFLELLAKAANVNVTLPTGRMLPFATRGGEGALKLVEGCLEG
jgi:hypothetical protein